MDLYNFERYLIKNKIKNNMKNNIDILNLLNINWRDYVNLNKKKYSKICILKNDDYELYLISWLPKQHTKIHLHPNNGCIMKLVYGKLNEIIYNNYNFVENSYNTNDNSFMCNDYGMHIISNISNNVSISLHLYSPPNFYENNQ